MDDPKRARNKPGNEPAQPLAGFMNNDEWDELVATAAGLLAEVENIPYPGVKEKVFALLQAIDGIHREPLRRLVHLFKEGVLEKVVTDPAIHTLMELYDLLPAGSSREAQPSAAEAAKWRARLTRTAPAKTEKPELPHWVPALRDFATLAQGQCEPVIADDRELLLCRVDDDCFAFELYCAEGHGSLAGATLDGYTLICPKHEGCYYDVRQGTRLGASGRLDCYPTRIDDEGRVLVGFGIPFTSHLPSF
jgi:nitrite reductase/ring-hydroxylating ferredoxin subunit